MPRPSPPDIQRAVQPGAAMTGAAMNCHIPLVAEMPHGGFRQSGYGKDVMSALG